MSMHCAIANGGCDSGSDLARLFQTIASLRNDEWEPARPLYFDGSCWSDAVREEAAVSFFDALAVNTTARALVLRNADLHLKAQKSLCEVFSQNHHLQSISLKNLQCNGAKMVVPSVLFKNTSLRELTLEQVVLDTAECVALKHLISHGTSLRSLSLKSVQMQAAPSTDALRSCSSIQSLGLNGIQLGRDQEYDQQVNDFVAALENNTSITTLTLEAMSLSTEHSQQLAALLAKNKHLEELSLDRNNLNAAAMEAIMEQGLAQNSTLHTMSVSHNPIGDDGVPPIVEGLCRNETLHALRLVECEIWRDGCVAMCEGMPRFTAPLRNLNMDSNEMEACPRELLAGLKQNLTIQSVLNSLPRLMNSRQTADRAGSSEDSSAWKEVDLYLRLNKANRRALFQVNSNKVNDEEDDDDMIPSLLEGAAGEPDVLFYFVRHALPNLINSQS